LKTAHPKRRGNRGIKRKETSQEVWRKLCNLRNAGPVFQNEYMKLRNQIAEENYDLVLKLAELMHFKHPDIPKDDLQSFAAYGLLDAIAKYDPSTGNKFETFATYRLFGSMYDEMRKSTWAPRLVRQRQAITDLHRERFIASNGRQPTDDELIAVLREADVEKPERVVKDGSPRGLISIYMGESSAPDASKEVWIAADTIQTEKHVDDEDDIFRLVVGDVGTLAARVCSLIYARNMTEEEVAAELDVDIDDVRQMHRQSLRHLRESDAIKKLMEKTER
jgi:RNA polymerase sigma factor for flagellar operon FliA